jgi:hypothetical protein
VFTVRPLEALGKVPLIIGIGVTSILVLLAINLHIELGRRDLSPTQVAANLATIVGIDPPRGMRNLNQTRDWRVRWWDTVVDYTVHGKHFWLGKGYGVNLAVDDRITLNKYNRSPHSAHVNFLARSGVPGLLLWTLLQGTFGFVMIRAYLRARRLQKERWARLNLWLLAYWAAFLTNASVDVYLEGPPGGIWFWTLLGFGVALTEAQRRWELENTPRRLFRNVHEAAVAP